MLEESTAAPARAREIYFLEMQAQLVVPRAVSSKTMRWSVYVCSVCGCANTSDYLFFATSRVCRLLDVCGLSGGLMNVGERRVVSYDDPDVVSLKLVSMC